MFGKKDIGIDLGTANTLVYIKGSGIVLREPSVVAYNVVTGDVLAVGNSAKEMIGRTPGNIVAVRPLKDGVIADFDITVQMINKFLKRVMNRSFFLKPRVMVCIPSGVTEVERRAVRESVYEAGASYAKLIEEPMAAAIGAGLPVDEPTGSMIVDIGGGTSEVAVISLNGVVVTNSIRVAGDKFDEHITNYVKKNHSLHLGERTAEDVKVKIGSAFEFEDEGSLDIKGRDVYTGLPKTINISAAEVREALREPISQVAEAIKSCLEKTPPELAADIIERGIMLSGGGAMLKGIDKYIEADTGIHVKIAERPLDCVAEGTGMALSYMDSIGDDYSSYRRK